MLCYSLKRVPLPADQILHRPEERDIQINHDAEQYISHPRFSAGQPGEMTAAVASPDELGLENGAFPDELFRHIQETPFNPCPPDTGFFLRLAWTDQPQSGNSILTGTHGSPDQAVTVLSGILEQDNAFPKGLYLRKVNGSLWLRGYVCDFTYRFPGNALFAFEMRRT